MAPTLFATEGSPPCRAVFLVLKAINLDAKINLISLANGDHKTPEFLKMNPLHAVPTLKDGNVAFGESRAIIGYLMNKYAPNSDLYPKDPAARAVVDSRLYYDASLFTACRNGIVAPLLFNQNLKEYEEKMPEAKEKIKVMDTFLEKSPYVAGEKLSVADLSIVAVISTLDASGFDLSFVPKTQAWLERMKKLPYYEVNAKGAQGMGAAMRKAKEELEIEGGPTPKKYYF